MIHKFFFRIDLGANYGLGHYSRVKSFINYLNIKNYKIVLDNKSNSSFLIKEQKNLLYLYREGSSFKNEIADAKKFIKLTKCKSTNSIVVKDSYRLGYIWEKYISKYCKKNISIGDNIYQKHFVDFYINHNPRLSKKNKQYSKTLKLNNKKNCQFLLGCDFALFNSRFSKKKRVASDFVFYNGGSGNPFVYEKIIKKLSLITKKKFRIILIVGPLVKNNIFKKIMKIFYNKENVNVIHQPRNILDIISATKIFVSSSGISIYESSFLKIPSLLFKMSLNQNLSEEAYEMLGHYFFLDKKDLKFTNQVSNLLLHMIKNKKKLSKLMSNTNLKVKNIKKNYLEKINL